MACWQLAFRHDLLLSLQVCSDPTTSFRSSEPRAPFVLHERACEAAEAAMARDAMRESLGENIVFRVLTWLRFDVCPQDSRFRVLESAKPMSNILWSGRPMRTAHSEP